MVPLDRVSVDTDQIVPKQFLKLVDRKGFGKHLFNDWRYQADGRPRGDFILNFPEYQGATILLTRANFGCGSSREHAVWALQDYGFRAIIAPSFADIFVGNCFKNGLLPVSLSEGEIDMLFMKAQSKFRIMSYELSVNLETQTVSDDLGMRIFFSIDPYKKNLLLEGLDDIALTLAQEEKIRKYEKRMPSFIIPSIP